MDDSTITCDKIIESFDEGKEVSRTTKQILMKRKEPVKRRIFIIYLHFY